MELKTLHGYPRRAQRNEGQGSRSMMELCETRAVWPDGEDGAAALTWTEDLAEELDS